MNLGLLELLVGVLFLLGPVIAGIYLAARLTRRREG
jgi:hypothetical protein